MDTFEPQSYEKDQREPIFIQKGKKKMEIAAGAVRRSVASQNLSRTCAIHYVTL